MVNFNIVFNIFGFGAAAVLIIYLFIRSGRHRKKQDEIHRRFLEEEEAANAVRKKEIPPELFYEADLAALPPIPEGDPHQVSRCAKRKMIRFPEPVSNLELKKQYGLSQMDFIAEYEENFHEYLKALTKWASALTEGENSKGDAVEILETVITLGGELRETYKLAADIYAAKRDKKRLDWLFNAANDNHFKDPSVRTHILEYINRKKGISPS